MKKEYIPPKVDVVMLAPCERIAAVDWEFSSKWAGEWYFEAIEDLGSGIAMGGWFDKDEDSFTSDGFRIKT